VRVQHLRWDGFRVPFATQFGTARGTSRFREGFLLRLTTDTGHTGWGEISPLPEFDGSTIPLALLALREWSPGLIGASVETLAEQVTALAAGRIGVAPVLCGFDVAALDVIARQRGTSVATLLGGVARTAVAVNATIGTVEPAQTVASARDAVARGFSCVKLKVGTARTIGEEVERVASVRQAIGENVRLRLDANGAWSPRQAIEIIQALAEFRLELIEQPVPANDIDGLRSVRLSVPVPVAADEAVATLEQAKRVIECEAADILVVKPMVAGGLRPARRIVDLASRVGLGLIVTTTIDMGVGAAASLHLAATLAEPALACGLATGPLLTSDLLVNPLPVECGTMTIPGETGLGVTVRLDELARHSTGTWGEAGHHV
jgi:L-Ala-D/L-Glu epimerase